MSIYRAGKITLTNLRASMAASYRPCSLRQSPPPPFKAVAFESGTTIPKGRVERGTIKVGEEVEIMGLIQADPLASRVTGVGMFNKIANQGQGHVEEEVEIMGLTQADPSTFGVIDVGMF